MRSVAEKILLITSRDGNKPPMNFMMSSNLSYEQVPRKCIKISRKQRKHSWNSSEFLGHICWPRIVIIDVLICRVNFTISRRLVIHETGYFICPSSFIICAHRDSESRCTLNVRKFSISRALKLVILLTTPFISSVGPVALFGSPQPAVAVTNSSSSATNRVIFFL